MGKMSHRDRLQALLARAFTGQESPVQRSLLNGLSVATDFPKPAAPVTTVADQWLEQLEAVEHMIPDSICDQTTRIRGKFRVDQLYREREIQGTCIDRGQSHQLYVHCGGSIPPAGCSCQVSESEYPCEHVDAFVQYLLGELEQTNSSLRQRINAGRFSSGKPDRKRFKIDRDAQEIQKLEGLLRGLSSVANSNDEELPAVIDSAVERVVWNFVCYDGSLSVNPIVQQQKKRGDGFTKGKKISLDRLQNENGLTLTTADSEVIDAIKLTQDRYGYRSHWTLDPMYALSRLVGMSNVTLNDQPCSVRPRSAELALRPKNDKWSFALVNEKWEQITGTAIGIDQHLATVDPKAQTIWYSSLPDGVFKIIQSLLQFPGVGKEHLEPLVKTARQLQKSLSIRLPDEIAGPLVPRASTPTIVLRSRPDGSLDYGLRVREEKGMLRKPGAQPAISAETVDGKPIQYHRDLTDEIVQASTLASNLGVATDEANHWNGSIKDFHQGLKFIEALQNEHENIEVLWDKTSEKPLKVLGNLTSKNVRVDITSKRNWFGISGQCDFGNHIMPLDELLQNLSMSSGSDSIRGDYMRVADGQWARISENLRQRLTRLKDATHVDRKTLTLDATSAPAIRDLMEGDVEVKATKNWHECLARLDRSEKLDPVLPVGLKAELRDYQVEGYKWLRRLAEWGVGGVLADDMGLGKTLQTLAVLLDRSSVGPALVIAPTSVGFNWVREAQRFAPDLKVHLYRETDRQEFLTSVGPGDLVICSYGLALRDESAIGKVEWATVVMDEAQAVKNSRSKTSQAIAGLNAKWTVALTGTPVENHLGELWSLFHLVSPGVFGGWEHFRKRYATPIEKHADDEARTSLATRLQPFVLRRTKAEVLTELPPRTEMNLYVDLSTEERDQYNRIRMSAIGEVDQIASLPNIQDQRFKLLALLTRLRQFACHPGIVNKQWTGSSAKLDQLCQTMEDLKEEGHRALVFSQFTEHLSLIRKEFEARGISYEYLDGSTPAAARQQRVDDFQNGTANAFLISLKAGGTGLNLTAADYVIHMDPWWNPAVEDQATDRAHRIGQDKPVMVYRIIARGTIEEEILSLHDTKRDLVAGILEGTTAAAKLTTTDLLAMIRGE